MLRPNRSIRHAMLLAAACLSLIAGCGGGSALAGQRVPGQTTCTGTLERVPGGFQVDGCDLTGSNARQVLRACSPGQQCVVTGTIVHCPGVRGACGELTRITDAHWGEALPACTEREGITRADEYWQVGNSLLIDGTIATREGGGDQAPYGRTKIMMDMTTCSGGSPMAIDHVSDRWIGHLVHVSGTAMKGVGGWYIQARDVTAAD